MNEEENKKPEIGNEPKPEEKKEGDVAGLVEGLKKEGLEDEDVVGTAFVMFADNKLSVGELRAVMNEVGYDLPEELEGLSEEALRAKLNEEVPGLAGEGEGEPKGDEPKPEMPEGGLKPAPSVEEDGKKPEDDEEAKRKAAFDLAGI